MTVTSPMESAGAVDITVSTESGPSGTSGADVFTYNNFTGPVPTIAGVSPGTGAAAGGQNVVISGAGFTGATAVKFRSTNATSFNFVSRFGKSTPSPPAAPDGNNRCAGDDE